MSKALQKLERLLTSTALPWPSLSAADHDKAWVRPFDKKQTGDIDASILTDHMMLQATELGLGSVWVCYFNPDILCREFELPEHLEPINILAIGYSNAGTADTSRFDRQRIALSQLVMYEK